jgi:hypothetical protein
MRQATAGGGGGGTTAAVVATRGGGQDGRRHRDRSTSILLQGIKESPRHEQNFEKRCV